MTHLRLCWLLVGFFSLIGVAVQGAELVETEIYRPAPYKQQSLANNQLKIQALTSANRTLTQQLFPIQSMSLGTPSAEELAALAPENNRTKALKIGIERVIPSLPDLVDWVWTPVLNGQAAQFVISSESAVNLRALLQVTSPLPQGVEIRVFSVEQNNEVYGPYQQQDFQAIDDGKTLNFWTPTVSGSQLGIEVFLPTGVNPKDIQLTIPNLSHIAFDLKSSQFKLANESILKFSSCDFSMACAPSSWQTSANAVARYVFTDDAGSSYLCTGTLLADKDTGTQIPYFMTAAHCITTPTNAATMDFYWFYQESSCGSGSASWEHSTGGADLLATHSELDSTLVRLRADPPAGVSLSGWALDNLQAGAAVVGIHHGSGYPKQFSQGSFLSYASLSASDAGYMVVKDPKGSFTQVSWTQGVTSPGSSGSGLWTTINGSPYFKGTLVGGASDCTTPQGADEYSRLERFYPYVSTWLGATGGPLGSLLDATKPPTGLVDGIIMARYLAGKRGTDLVKNVSASSLINSTQLEAKLDLLKPSLDIDGDAIWEADKDGLLLVRYLVGLRDSSLTGQLSFSNSKRKSPAELKQYIETVLF